ncbi:hypothetical protein D521_0251 [beta proteobacterium CB]|nr:hypothetical protein D521_0251 [beta proteobacterium CB]
MKQIALYCKSYQKDFLRLKKLLQSVNQYNVDAIPFYISTPEEQKLEMLAVLGAIEGYQWISDESIVTSNLRVPAGMEKTRSGGLSQQTIKSEFWRLGLVENYVCLDSDCIFIKDFRISDFMASDGYPYTVMYQNKDYYQLAINRGHARVLGELSFEADNVKAIFGRKGPNYYCPCPPFIWSSKVWESLDDEFLKPKGMTLWDINTAQHPETLLYLEALLNFKAIPLHPIEQLFRIYYYDWHYFLLRRNGETLKKLTSNYLGVIYQSSWNSILDYGGSEKSFLSQSLKKLKRVGRFIESYF